MNNKSFYDLDKEDKLSEVYVSMIDIDEKVLVFDNGTDKKKFAFKKKLFIYAEHVLFSAYCVYGKAFKVNDVLALYTAMPETFIKNMDSEKYNIAIKAVYYLKSFAGSESKLRKYINFYLDQNNKHIYNLKIFARKDNETIEFKEPKFFHERIQEYKITLNSVCSIHIDNEKKSKIKIGDNRIGLVLNERIKEKNSYDESVVDNINNILSTIHDMFIESMNGEYKKQNKKIKLYDVDGKEIIYCEDKFKLNGYYTHLAGKTGSGKTVYTDIIIKKLAESGKKILIITDNTNNSINYKERLDKLGIKSTILTGKKRNHYIERYYSSKRQKSELDYKGESPLETIMKNKAVIDNIDNFCSMANEPSKDEYNNLDVKKECSKCKEGFLNCGFYSLYREMINSDVIIATAKTLLLSKAPRVFDLEERTLFEISILYSDLVIVDEVDEIQKEFDSSFINEVKIYSGSSVDDNHTRGDIESLLKIVHNIDRLDISTKSIVNEFKKEVRILDNIVNVLILLFLNKGNQDFIREAIRVNRNFNLISLIEEFFQRYIQENENRGAIKAYYDFFINDKSIEQITEKYFKLLENYDVEKVNLENEDDDQSIEEICDEIFRGLRKDLVLINEKLDIKFKILRSSVKSSKAQKEDIRTKYLIFIMLIALIDAYYKNIREKLKAVVGYIKSSKDNGLRDLVFRYLYKEDIALVPESFLQGFASGYSLSEETENNKSILILKNINYSGIGREILFNTTKNLSILYNTKQIPMFMASATSIDTRSSLYTIKHKVNRLLENDNQKRNECNDLSRKERKKLRIMNKSSVILKCHIFKDEKGICYISGSDKDNVQRNIERITCQLNQKLLPDLIRELKKYEEDNNIKKGILITASSARIANIIFNSIKIGNVTKKILWTPAFNEEFNSQIHVEKANVERISDFNVDILIAVNKSISRGYNIMDLNNNEAYFRHIIIANRYLPSPSDTLTTISYLHDYLTRQYMKDRKNAARDFKYLKEIMGKLQIKLKFQETYSSKDDDIKNMIAGNMFGDLSQLKGRGQRGGAQCIIHLIDSKFYWETAIFSQTEEGKGISKVIEKEEYFKNGERIIVDDSNSVFNKFKSILDKNDPLVVRLFDDMIEAFDNHHLIVH